MPKQKKVLIIVLFISSFLLLLVSFILSFQEITFKDSSANTGSTDSISATNGTVLDTDIAGKKTNTNLRVGTPIVEPKINYELLKVESAKYAKKSIPIKRNKSLVAPVHQRVFVIIYDSHELDCCKDHMYKYTAEELSELLADTLVQSSIEKNYLPRHSERRQNISIEIKGYKTYKSQAPTYLDEYGNLRADYNRIINENNLCKRLNDGEFDEIWLWADRTGGFWESLMAGPQNQIYYINGTPITRNDCNRAMFIMGLNYENYWDAKLETINGQQIVTSMEEPSAVFPLHSYGHRIENTISVFLDSKLLHLVKEGDTAYEFFGKTYNSLPNKAYIGNIHYPPNTMKEFGYYEINSMLSDYNKWTPQHFNTRNYINCKNWDCLQGNYLKMWNNNIPGRCVSSSLRKLDKGKMPNLWYAIFKNQYYYENKNCVKTEEYLVRNGRIWNRNQQIRWSRWLDITSKFNTVGSGAFKSFSSYSASNGDIEQYMVRGNSLWYRHNKNRNDLTGWTNITKNYDRVGSGEITSFVAANHPMGYKVEYMTRGGKLWTTENAKGWRDITSNFPSVKSPITAFSTRTTQAGIIQQHLTRGGIIYFRDNSNGWSAWTNVTSTTGYIGTGTISSFATSSIIE
jgi:hypothetical protein